MYTVLQQYGPLPVWEASGVFALLAMALSVFFAFFAAVFAWIARRNLRLALIAAPIVTRTTEDVLKLQPIALRESGVALGAPLWTTIRKILWKSAGSGILTAGLLAFARISGETAPLLFTALNNQFFTWNLTQPMASLPIVIFQFALSPYDDWQKLAWTGALIVAAAVLATNIIARIITREPRRS